MTKTNNKKGFTIIEVVLVLAIAGLIFLMVFIALPALQRSQRNTRRRQDMARISSAIVDYQTANNRLPFKKNGSNLEIDEDFVTRYVDQNCTGKTLNVLINGKEHNPSITYSSCGDQFTDPDGTPYVIQYGVDQGHQREGATYHLALDEKKDAHVILINTNAKCNPDDDLSTKSAHGANNYTIKYMLEGGAIYCGDNQ